MILTAALIIVIAAFVGLVIYCIAKPLIDDWHYHRELRRRR